MGIKMESNEHGAMEQNVEHHETNISIYYTHETELYAERYDAFNRCTYCKNNMTSRKIEREKRGQPSVDPSWIGPDLCSRSPALGKRREARRGSGDVGGRRGGGGAGEVLGGAGGGGGGPRELRRWRWGGAGGVRQAARTARQRGWPARGGGAGAAEVGSGGARGLGNGLGGPAAGFLDFGGGRRTARHVARCDSRGAAAGSVRRQREERVRV